MLESINRAVSRSDFASSKSSFVTREARACSLRVGRRASNLRNFRRRTPPPLHGPDRDSIVFLDHGWTTEQPTDEKGIKTVTDLKHRVCWRCYP